MSGHEASLVATALQEWCIKVSGKIDACNRRLRQSGKIEIFTLCEEFSELLHAVLEARGLESSLSVSRVVENDDLERLTGFYQYEATAPDKAGSFPFTLSHGCCDTVPDLAFNVLDKVNQAVGWESDAPDLSP